VLDQVLQPGPARERFVRRWRAGKVSKTLEVLILRIGLVMDRQAKRRRGLRIVMYGRFTGGPMSREHNRCGPSCRFWVARYAQSSGAPRSPAARVGNARTGKPSVTKPPTAAATAHPTGAPDRIEDGERVHEIDGRDFVEIDDEPEP